jgi:hypothetical protein
VTVIRRIGCGTDIELRVLAAIAYGKAAAGSWWSRAVGPLLAAWRLRAASQRADQIDPTLDTRQHAHNSGPPNPNRSRTLSLRHRCSICPTGS